MNLLTATQGLLERTYASASGVEDLGRFIIGDRGYGMLCRQRELVQVVEPVPAAGAGSKDGARVLIRLDGRTTALSIYFPDDLIARLEARPPVAVLDEQNIDDFADFVEEIDHFLVLHHDLSRRREVNLLALETRANVSKALVVSHFLGRLSRRRRLGEQQRVWVRYHLFAKKRFSDPDGRLRRRYRDARRFAVRLLDRLDGMPARRRIRELRRWNSLPAAAKVRELASA